MTNWKDSIPTPIHNLAAIQSIAASKWCPIDHLCCRPIMDIASDEINAQVDAFCFDNERLARLGYELVYYPQDCKSGGGIYEFRQLVALLPDDRDPAMLVPPELARQKFIHRDCVVRLSFGDC